MLDQLKRTSGQNEVILKNLITGQEQNKNNDMLKYIDIELADLNNVIAEIAVRFGIMRKTSEDAYGKELGKETVGHSAKLFWKMPKKPKTLAKH